MNDDCGWTEMLIPISQPLIPCYSNPNIHHTKYVALPQKCSRHLYTLSEQWALVGHKLPSNIRCTSSALVNNFLFSFFYKTTNDASTAKRWKGNFEHTVHRVWNGGRTRISQCNMFGMVMCGYNIMIIIKVIIQNVSDRNCSEGNISLKICYFCLNQF